MSAPAPTSKVNDAVLDYVAGEGCQACARRHGISEGRLKRALVERGLWRSKAERYALSAAKAWETRGTIPIDTDGLVRRYLAGESPNSLAELHDVSRMTILSRLEDAGVDLRGSAEANQLLADSRSPEERRALAAAAHDAVRGIVQTEEHRAKIARTKQERLSHVSSSELLLAGWLGERGVDTVPQLAVGPYNVDLAADPVAVEVFGGGWHGTGRHGERAPERFRYLFDRGWALMIVWVDRRQAPLRPEAADEVVAFVEQMRRHPSPSGQQRVIWGDGQRATGGGLDVDDLTLIPPRR